MNLIRVTLLLLIVSMIFSCDRSLSPEEFFEACPYELRYGGAHYLEVPIDIIPQQKVYNIGDTLTIRMMFSDSIMDLTRQINFKIEGFPFEPLNLLYKVTDNEWDHGYRLNELIVDEERFNTRQNSQSMFSDDMRGFTLYEDGIYHFEYQLVLQTPGRYLTLISDQFQDNASSGRGDENEAANRIEFDGRCPSTGFIICSVIKGDNHFEDYISEIQLLDEQVYRGNLTSIHEENRDHIGGGSNSIEWIGMYGFEVVE